MNSNKIANTLDRLRITCFKPQIYNLITCFSALLFSSVYVAVLANSIHKSILIVPCIGALIIAYILLTKANNIESIFHCCFCCMIVIQLFFGYFLMVEYTTWDVYSVVKNARALVNETYYNAEYFARYPNNIGLMLLFAGVFTVTDALWSSTSVYFLVALNIIAIDTALILMLRIVHLLYNKTLAFRMGICFSLFAPLYLYVPICYTDTFCMPFLTGAVFLVVKIVKTYEKNCSVKNLAIALLLGIVMMLGMKIKASLVIILIAAVIYWGGTLTFKATFRTLASVIMGMLVVSLVWNSFVEPISRVTDELRDQCQFPVYHWIMMGLEGSGNYNSTLVKYTASFSTYAERVAADLSKLSEQLSELGIWGVLQQFYKKAVKYGWNYGTFFAERYIGDAGDAPILKNVLHEFFLTKGKYHNVIYVISQSFWLAYMGFMMVGLIQNIFMKDCHKLFIHLLVIGCMMFFMIWETHPRYILHYSLFVVTSGVITLDSLIEWCKNRNSRLLRKS